MARNRRRVRSAGLYLLVLSGGGCERVIVTWVLHGIAVQTQFYFDDDGIARRRGKFGRRISGSRKHNGIEFYVSFWKYLVIRIWGAENRFGVVLYYLQAERHRRWDTAVQFERVRFCFTGTSLPTDELVIRIRDLITKTQA